MLQKFDKAQGLKEDNKKFLIFKMFNFKKIILKFKKKLF